MLTPWKKSYDQPRQHIKKQRHYFVNKGPSSPYMAMVFPVVMYGGERWTIQKAEHWRTDAFELWCWAWTSRRSNQSILKEISPEYSLEVLVLKLKLQNLATWCEELTRWKRPWCWERLKVGGEGDDRGWDRWMASLTQWTWVWINAVSWWWTGRPGVLSPWGCKESDTTQLNWSELSGHILDIFSRVSFWIFFFFPTWMEGYFPNQVVVSSPFSIYLSPLEFY